MVILFLCDQKLAESQFSPTHASTEDNERTKTTPSGTKSVKAVQLKFSG